MADETNEALAATIYSFGLHIATDAAYASKHPGEAAAAAAAWVLLNASMPDLTAGGAQSAAQKIAAMAQKHLSGSKITVTPAPAGPVPMPYPNFGGPMGGTSGAVNLPAVQKTVEELRQQMQKQSLMMTVITNIMQMQHEALKNVAQNLRG
jgi:hypothetical protein